MVSKTGDSPKMVDIFFREYSGMIMQSFKSFLENDLYVDLIFICGNKKKFNAHQIVISYLSKFLSDILIDNQYCTNSKIVYVCIPDMKPRIMDSIIKFVYSGHITLLSGDVHEFHDGMKLLGMPTCSFTPPSRSISIHEISEIYASKTCSLKESTVNFRSNTASSNVEKCSRHTLFPEQLVETKDEFKSESYAPVISNIVSLGSPSLHPLQSLSNTFTYTVPLRPRRDDSESIRRIAREVFLRLMNVRNTSSPACNNSSRKIRGRTNSAGIKIMQSVLKKWKVECFTCNRYRKLIKRRDTNQRSNDSIDEV